MKSRIPGRHAVVCAVILALGIPSVAIGFGEGQNLRLGKRNPSRGLALSSETQIIASNSTYGTRQSNKGSGGGAIYGCRSTTGNEPCIRASNLKDGHAFEFATAGKEAGTITVKDTTGAPFTTNATGVATGLNADKVDGNDATDFAAAGDLLFAAVSSSAALGANRGAVGASGGAGSYTVKLNRDVSACSFTATTTDTPAPVAVTPPTAAAKDTVTVTTGDPAAAHAFHLQVIC